jgi:hypothetical protein
MVDSDRATAVRDEMEDIEFHDARVFGAAIRIACSGVVWDSLDPNHKLEDWED